MTKAKKPAYEQDAAAVAKMLDFYKASFTEVHSVTCMNCNRVIGVEVSPSNADGIVLIGKGRTFYNFNDLTLSVRERLDDNGQGAPMYGYECVCGNTTILAAVEKGAVPERTILVGSEGVVSDSGAVAPSSPYEMAQLRERVTANQADNKQADYEKNGGVERYETFKIERVK